MGRQVNYNMMQDVIRSYEEILAKDEYKNNEVIKGRHQVWVKRRDAKLRKYRVKDRMSFKGETK